MPLLIVTTVGTYAPLPAQPQQRVAARPDAWRSAPEAHPGIAATMSRSHQARVGHRLPTVHQAVQMVGGVGVTVVVR